MRRSWIEENRFDANQLKNLLSCLKKEFLNLSAKHEQLNQNLLSFSDTAQLSSQADEINQCFNRIDNLRTQLNPLISIWESLDPEEKAQIDTSCWDDVLDEISDVCHKFKPNRLNDSSQESLGDLKSRIASRKGAG